jgi:UDP-GlcNAc:undecaprenyl-phosphate GlcNAc-1-phosphate transferase
MKTAIVYASFGILSLLFTLILIPILKKIAVKINLVDKPNFRKLHQEPVPLVGGIAVAITFFMLMGIQFLLFSHITEYLPIFTSAFLLLIMGVIDDKMDLKAKYKLAIQLLLSFIIASSSIRITSLFGVFGIYEIALWAQYALTIIVITGVVNAFNLMDGVDGLIGGLSLLGFTMFLVSAVYFNNAVLGFISSVFIGSIIGFLRFNLSSKKIFMGDSGSLFLGFILVTLGIQLMEKQSNVSDTNYGFGFLLLVAFFAIPVLDSLRVYMGRIKRGNSPFSADKSHLHHLLLMAGLTHKKVAIAIISTCMIFYFIGFGLASYFSITLVIVATLFVFWSIIRFLLMVKSLQEWKETLKKLEQR